MESSRKRRGFMKGKLMPFYRSSSKPASNVNQYSAGKVIKPSQSSTSTAAYVVHRHHHHQEYVVAPPTHHQQQPQKVSFIVPSPAENNRAERLLSQLDKLYGISVDESVDMKTACYISSVQERFKLEPK